MKFYKNTKYISITKIIVLLFLALITRFLYLSSVPNSLTIDEVGIGYNAFSILKTGRDEWGEKMPLQFRSVNDYKPPILIYVTTPFVALFGETEIATRLPVAIFSSITIIAFYFFLKKHIFKKKNYDLSFYSSVMLAISPWHIFFSRSGFEAILGLFFLILFVDNLLSFINTQSILSFIGIVIFGLIAGISYHSTRLFIPVITLFYMAEIYNSLKNIAKHGSSSKKIATGVIFISSFVLAYWFLKTYLSGAGAVRAKMVFIGIDYEYRRVLLPLIEKNQYLHLKEYFLLILFWFKRYLEYFSPNFYINNGLKLTLPDQPGQGIIYGIEFIGLLFGSIVLLRNTYSRVVLRDYKKIRKLLILWLLIGFLPASLANNSQHALRSLLSSIPIFVIIILGFRFIYSYISKVKKNQHFKLIFITFIVIGYLVGISRFIDNYLVHYYYQKSEYRQVGWKEMAIYASKNSQYYDNIYIDHRFGSQGPYNVGVPRYYFLFYSNYDPASYNQDPKRAKGSVNFSNFKFEEIDWFSLSHSGNNLYIASPWSFPLDQIKPSQIQYQTYYPDGKINLMAVSD